MPKKNKVKFNICNVHYALLELGADGAVSFGTPVAMPGAVSLSLDPNGEPSNFYADGYAYYRSATTWDTRATWSLPWCRRASAPTC